MFEAGLKRNKYSYADYACTPEGSAYQLLEGDLVMTPAPSTVHQRISRRIVGLIDDFASENDAGEVLNAPCDVYLDDENVVQPDIFFVSTTRRGIVERKFVRGAPELIIEILSETSSRRDLVPKRALYARFGVKEFWIVSPEEECVDVLVLSGGEFRLVRNFRKTETLESPNVVGLKLDLSKVFS